jgi:hypothetical protein
MTPLANTGNGPLSDRPQPSDENRGLLWIDNSDAISISTGSAWVDFTTDGGGGGGGVGGFRSGASFAPSIASINADGNTFDIFGGSAPDVLELSIVNPDPDRSMAVMATYVGGAIYFENGTHSGFYQGSRTVAMSPSDVSAQTVPFFADAPPTDPNGVLLPGVVATTVFAVNPGDTVTLEVLDQADVAGDGLAHTVNSAYTANLTAIGVPLPV